MFVLVLAAVGLSACAVQSVEPAISSPLAQPESPLDAAPAAIDPLIAGQEDISARAPFELEEGLGGVRGRVFSSLTNNTINTQGAYLPNFICPGEELPEDPNDFDTQDCFWMYETSSSPSALTDETGYFEFRNVEPGIYLFFVGDMHSIFAFYETADEVPIRFLVLPGEITELGNIILEYPY